MLIHLLLIIAFVSTCVCLCLCMLVCACVCVFRYMSKGKERKRGREMGEEREEGKKRATLFTLSIDIMPQVLYSPPLFTPAMIFAITMPSCIVRPQDSVGLVEQFPGVFLTDCSPLRFYHP